MISTIFPDLLFPAKRSGVIASFVFCFVTLTSIFHSLYQPTFPACFSATLESKEPEIVHIEWNSRFGWNLLEQLDQQSRCSGLDCSQNRIEGCFPAYKLTAARLSSKSNFVSLINARAEKKILPSPSRLLEISADDATPLEAPPVLKRWGFILVMSLASSYSLLAIILSIVHFVRGRLRDDSSRRSTLLRLLLSAALGIWLLTFGAVLYEPIEMTISGPFGEKPKLLKAELDLGNGLNAIDTFYFLVNAAPKNAPRVLSVYRPDEHGELFVQRIAIEGNKASLSELAKRTNAQMLYGKLYVAPFQRANFEYHGGALEIEFTKHLHSGRAIVEIDGDAIASFDLKSDIQTAFKVRIVPAAPSEDGQSQTISFFQNASNINARSARFGFADASPLKIDRIIARASSGKAVTPIIIANRGIPIARFPSGWNSYRSGFSCIVAVIVTLLFFFSGEFFQYLRPILGRKGFATSGALSLAVFALYGLGFLPGGITIDGLQAWASATSNQFTNWQPFFYSAYLRAFIQFYEDILPISAVQIAYSVLFVIGILCVLRRRGAPLPILVLSAILIIGSGLFGLLGISIFKDVPFTIGLLLISFVIYFHSLFGKETIALGSFEWWSLVFLSAFISGLRHNGLTLIVLIPLFFAFSNTLSWRGAVRFASMSFAVFAATLYGFGYSVGAHQRTNYPLLNMVWESLYIQSVVVQPDWNTSNHEVENEILERFTTVEKFQRLGLGVIFQLEYNFLPRPEDVSAITALTIKLALQHPWAAFDRKIRDSVEMVMGWEYIWDNGWISPRLDPIFFGSYLPSTIRFRPVFPALSEFLRTNVLSMLHDKSFNPWRLWHFSAVLPLFLVLAGALLFRRFPSTALFCFFLLLQLMFLFVVLPANNLRYVYFIFIGGYLTPALLWTEFVVRRK